MERPLKREVEYFRRRRKEFVKKHNGKLLAIKGEEVLGVYDNYLEAAEDIYATHEYGTVLMQPVEREERPMLATAHTTTQP